ncbi:MAG: radical SAM family heme chaperone HemW [Lachnospiraceae bacterium]|nr:radical SAM family heme chaperone HemW [Lachnospiraceae bacterium]
MEKEQKKLAVYVHIPFCAKKCGYCDFLSAPATGQVREAYIRALRQEISAFAERNRKALLDYYVCSVFFGGGTPSLLFEGVLGGILGLLREKLIFREDAEITVECNPNTLTTKKLSSYQRDGVNRLSIGLQSADNRELALLGRIHTFEDFLLSYRMAREAGFSNINIDIMAALPGQTMDSYAKTLGTVVKLKPEHISAYSLIIEEGTPFYERYGERDFGGLDGKPSDECLPDEETERAMYQLTGEILGEAGYSRYEISNYAREGKECRHNICYWNRTQYLGFGLGAASFFDGCRYCNVGDLTSYMEMAACGKPVCKKITRLSKKDSMEEFMFLGLRMMCGVSESDFSRQFGMGLFEVYGEVLKKHVSLGLIKVRDGRVSLTERGIDVSNAVFCDFLLDG